MKGTSAKPAISAAGAKRRRSAPPRPASAAAPEGPILQERAVAEFLARSAEEIRSHLALAAQVKSKMAQLLGATVEELERARRLETLAASIAGAVPDGSPASTSYFEQEIKTLRKAQKLLGIPTPPRTEPERTAPPSPFPPIEAPVEPSLDRTVLLLEDEPGTVRLLKYFLEKESLRVLSFANGPDGLRAAVRERPDLIILDLMIPGMDGTQLLKALQRTAETAAIPVFVLSSLAQEADILRAIEGGATDYFTKPFSPPVLIAKVKKVLEDRRG
jgi:CheY-like chemotaxis protein